MAVPLTRNVFPGKRPYLFVVFSKRSENVLFSFFLHTTTRRYSYRKIFAVLSIILRLQKRGTGFLGNDHHHHHHHHHHHQYHHHHYHQQLYHHRYFLLLSIFFTIIISNKSQMTSKLGKNKKVARASQCFTDVLISF